MSFFLLFSRIRRACFSFTGVSVELMALLMLLSWSEREGEGGEDRHESYVLHSSTQSPRFFGLTTDLVSKTISHLELNTVREWVRETSQIKAAGKWRERRRPQCTHKHTHTHTQTMTQTLNPSLILKQFHIWQLIHNKQLGLLIIAQSPTGSRQGAKSLLPEGITRRVFIFHSLSTGVCNCRWNAHTPGLSCNQPVVQEVQVNWREDWSCIRQE